MEDVVAPHGGPIEWTRLPGAIGKEMIEYSACMVLTPLVFGLARTFPLERAHAVRNAALHITLAVVGVAIVVDVAVELQNSTRLSRGRLDALRERLGIGDGTE
jgi:hypothetical protein